MVTVFKNKMVQKLWNKIRVRKNKLIKYKKRKEKKGSSHGIQLNTARHIAHPNK